jgi:hypothetical protein
LSYLSGGGGVKIFLEDEFKPFSTWQEDFDPKSPTEILVDINVVDDYEKNYIAIKKWLPWVNV